MKDQALSDRLQLECSLTLESATNAIRSSEALIRRKQELSASTIDRVHATLPLNKQQKRKSFVKKKHSSFRKTQVRVRDFWSPLRVVWGITISPEG